MAYKSRRGRHFTADRKLECIKDGPSSRRTVAVASCKQRELSLKQYQRQSVKVSYSGKVKPRGLVAEGQQVPKTKPSLTSRHGWTTVMGEQ